MKPSPDQSLPASPITVRTTPATLYQIFRQTCAGAFVPCFQSDSPVISVEAFLRQSPAFDCCEVRRWDQRYQRMIAAVQLTHTNTVFGFPSLQRATIRTCNRPSELAREIQMRQFLREMMRQELAMTHIN